MIAAPIRNQIMSGRWFQVFKHAVVVGKFAPLHRGHQLLLDRAVVTAEELTVIVWANPDYPEMSNEVRASWVRALYPSARVLVGFDGPHDCESETAQREYVAQVLARHGLIPDVVLTSESYGDGFAAHLGVPHICVDESRTAVPISGTVIRADVHAHRHFLHPIVYSHFVDRVVFLGAESTGKSTLTQRMADVMGTAYVGEYGREYYEERNGVLTEADYVEIAERHREKEDAALLLANRYLFVDTNALTTMMFSHLYNRTSAPALRELADTCASRYRQVIVCDDDIAFEQDGWRDSAEWRTRMQGMVLHDLAVRGIPYETVRGSLDERVGQVKAILDGSSLGAIPTTYDSTGPRPATLS
jgi:HTH-type transcriptional regulator, transcriptional repressor of NAD biosynthesis genes